MQFISLSTRHRRCYPLHRRQMARPKYFEARSASLRATTPGFAGFRGVAFFRGGDDSISISGGNGLMALPGVVGPVGGD